MNRTVSKGRELGLRRLIFGCGYLGAQVAHRWRDLGDQVYAVTRFRERAAEFRGEGLVPIIADITKSDSLVDLPEVDTVLVAVGMDRSRYTSIREVYVDGFKNILEYLPDAIGHLVYISSTGVYGADSGAWVSEESRTDPKREGGRACLDAEQELWASRFADRATVLRLAGIYGPDRIPSLERIAQRAFDQSVLQGYLNLIHRDDATEAIVQVADRRLVGETILISDGHPVSRPTYYEAVARRLGVKDVDWAESATGGSQGFGGKRINNEKMIRLLELKLKFPSFQDGLSALLP